MCSQASPLLTKLHPTLSWSEGEDRGECEEALEEVLAGSQEQGLSSVLVCLLDHRSKASLMIQAPVTVAFQGSEFAGTNEE